MPIIKLTIYNLNGLGLVGIGRCAMVSVLKTWSRQLLILLRLKAGYSRAALGILGDGNPCNAHGGRHLDS